MWFRRDKDEPSFLNGKSPQTDEEFVQSCQLPPKPRVRTIALTIRKVIANLNEVEPRWIRHDLQLKELAWSSMILVEFVMELEDSIKLNIPDNEYAEFGRRATTVNDLVDEVLRLFTERLD